MYISSLYCVVHFFILWCKGVQFHLFTELFIFLFFGVKAHFSHSMSIIMANCDYSSAVRLGAAIELNKLLQMITFYMSHENMQKQFLTNVPAKVRSQIKTNVMSVLPITSSDGPLLDNVCLCLAKFAIIHLEEKSCSDILAKLVSIVIEGTDKEKEEAMAAINRICIMVCLILTEKQTQNLSLPFFK